MPQLRNKSLVKHNLELWTNDLFLKDGFFTNISQGETDIYSRDISALSLITSDPSNIDGTVWQSAFKNWVHESGLIPTATGTTAPTVASGVYVNGTFYPTYSFLSGYDASYAHTIDFANGRVIFNSPLTSSDIVQANFAYKEIFVDSATSFENEQKEFYIETTYKDNPYQTGVITYPEENSRTLPMVLIDVSQINYEPYEIGNSSNVLNLQGSFIVWTRDEFTRDLIEDLLTYQENEVIEGINFNSAPFPLGYQNSKNLAYTNYASLANLNSQYYWRKIYLDNIDSRRITPYYNIERTQVNFLIRVYPNF